MLNWSPPRVRNTFELLPPASLAQARSVPRYSCRSTITAVGRTPLGGFVVHDLARRLSSTAPRDRSRRPRDSLTAFLDASTSVGIHSRKRLPPTAVGPAENLTNDIRRLLLCSCLNPAMGSARWRVHNDTACPQIRRGEPL